MEEWTVVEEKYESLARTDPSHADKIKQEMADQFEVEYKERLFIFSYFIILNSKSPCYNLIHEACSPFICCQKVFSRCYVIKLFQAFKKK